MVHRQLTTSCSIVGGGPAGMMLGFLLARAGLDVVILEKHADFLRDFRGDTIHPSTMELLREIGLLDSFLARPHQKVERLTAEFGNLKVTMADFSHLPTAAKFVALMPQWDFLDFLADEGKRYQGFRLVMTAEAVDLLKEGGRVIGVRAVGPEGPLEVRAHLVAGCDGRHSLVRSKAGLPLEQIGAPMDVLWFRLSRSPTDPTETMGHVGLGHMIVLINRGDYWQCGFVIPKGTFAEIQRRGLSAFRDTLRHSIPFAPQRADEIESWDQVKLLTVGVDRLRRWYAPGVLCIGDAAHTMSPIGGVGINLAIQDAVAAANILAGPLQHGEPSEEHLRQVQQRREPPTRKTQALQVFIQNRVIRRMLDPGRQVSPPLLVRALNWFPLLQRLTARVIGIGFLPEHVQTPPSR